MVARQNMHPSEEVELRKLRVPRKPPTLTDSGTAGTDTVTDVTDSGTGTACNLHTRLECQARA